MSVRISVKTRGFSAIANRIDQWFARAGNAVETATGHVAQKLRKEIVTGIRDQAPGGMRFKPLAESTKARKGSSKALIDHGDLVRSINVTKVGGGDFFVGVHRNVTARDGQPMVNIAEVHEFGTRDGRIPARPYLRPTYKVWVWDAERVWAGVVAREMRLPVGVSKAIGGLQVK